MKLGRRGISQAVAKNGETARRRRRGEISEAAVALASSAKPVPRAGWLDPVAQACEQRRLQLALQAADAVADGGSGDAKRVGSRAKAAQPGGGVERLQVRQHAGTQPR